MKLQKSICHKNKQLILIVCFTGDFLESIREIAKTNLWKESLLCFWRVHPDIFRTSFPYW